MSDINDHDLLVRMDERLSHLSTELLGIGGNPGRMANVEERVRNLEETQSKLKSWMAGAASVMFLGWQLLIWLFNKYVH